ncbi:rab-GTPase-TBC domain-containing protein, partial [Pilobolus umbonatus]
SEEAAFWMLVTTIHDYLPHNMYDTTMEGANIDQSVLMMLVNEHLPDIWNKMSNGKCFLDYKISNELPPITLVTNHWFLTLFINILPVETVLRLWDCFFIEGYHIMFKAALTIIKLNQVKILDLQDPIEIFQTLKNMPRRLIDCHKFMEVIHIFII